MGEPQGQGGAGEVRDYPANGFGAVAALTRVRIVAAELAHVTPAFPLAFAHERGRRALFAILGLEQGRNLFVSPDGTWLAPYLPAWVRCARSDMDAGVGYTRLRIEGGRLIGAGPADGGGGSDGGPDAFAEQLGRDQAATDEGAAALSKAGLIEPWPLRVRFGDETHALDGLHRLDERALAALDDRRFLVLRHAGALPLAYAQLHATRNVAMLARLHELHRHGASRKETPEPLDPFADPEASFDFR